MSYIIKTYKDIELTVNSDTITLKEIQKDLNNYSIIVLSMDPVIMNKNNIKIIVPAIQPEDGPDVYTLTTADGIVYKVKLENYVAVEISTALNNPTTEFVLIGDILINRNYFDLLQ